MILTKSSYTFIESKKYFNNPHLESLVSEFLDEGYLIYVNIKSRNLEDPVVMDVLIAGNGRVLKIDNTTKGSIMSRGRDNRYQEVSFSQPENAWVSTFPNVFLEFSIIKAFFIMDITAIHARYHAPMYLAQRFKNWEKDLSDFYNLIENFRYPYTNYADVQRDYDKTEVYRRKFIKIISK